MMLIQLLMLMVDFPPLNRLTSHTMRCTTWDMKVKITIQDRSALPGSLDFDVKM